MLHARHARIKVMSRLRGGDDSLPLGAQERGAPDEGLVQPRRVTAPQGGAAQRQCGDDCNLLCTHTNGSCALPSTAEPELESNGFHFSCKQSSGIARKGHLRVFGK